MEFNEIIESREVEFFEKLLSCDDKSQITTEIGKSQEEIPSKIVEQSNKPSKSQRVRKQKELRYDEIDSQEFIFV